MKSKIVGIFAVLILLSPSVTLAFESKNEQVFRLTNDVWLYVNTAQYGSSDREVSLPIATAPSWVPRISGEYLRYQVLLSGRSIAGLDTTAIVLSDAPIVDNRYVVPAGASHSFTLMALVTIPDEVPPTGLIDLSLQVTSGE
jgi:hypothetical protein